MTSFLRGFLTAIFIVLAAVGAAVVAEQTHDLVIVGAVTAVSALIGWQTPTLIGDKLTPKQLRALSYILPVGGFFLVAVSSLTLQLTPDDITGPPFPFVPSFP
jgi:drug/metabolite transporter (DMT)-like permease